MKNMKKPEKIFDLARKTDRDQVIAEHKSITHLEPPEYNFLRVFKTPFAGFGVIAHKTIKKNQIICSYQGKTVLQEIKDGVMPRYDEVTTALAEEKKQITQNGDRPLTEEELEKLDEFANQRKKLIRSYAFVLKKNNRQCLTVLSHRQAGIAAFVNCSWNGFANAETRLENNKIVYRTLRDIQSGEEILIDYGCDYTDSQEFHHIFPIGSRSIDSFLEKNAGHYPHQPIALDKTDQELLGTQATHVLLPHYCSDSKTLKSLNGTEINLLPVIEMVKQTTDNKFIPLPSQQFITTLMYACLKLELRENKTLFDKLIQKKVCVDFVTANGRSAWHILTSQYRNSPQIDKICMKLSTAIYHVYDKRGWANAYRTYLNKNLKETSAENEQAIFSAILVPPKKTGYKRVNLIQEDFHQATNLSVVAETAPITETTQFDKSEEKINPPAEIKSDIVMEPPSELKRSDSIPSLETIPPAENKLITLSLLVEKSRRQKRKQDRIQLTGEPVVKKQITEFPHSDYKIESKEDIKPGDISTIWWDAALTARKGDSTVLNKLISSKENLMAVNWNYTPLTGFYRGVTLAFLAAALCDYQKPDLLEILSGLPVETHQNLDWNAGAVDESNPSRGITLAWIAAFLARTYKKKPGLLKILAKSPSLTDLDWNAGPLDPKHPFYGNSLAYLVVQALHYWYAHEAARLMIQALIISPQQKRHEINWHAKGRDKFTLAQWAIRIATRYNYGYFDLFNALLDSPITVFMKIDWNMTISEPIPIKASDPSLAMHAVALAQEGKPELLDKLLALPQSIFDKLDWNSGAYSEDYPSLGNSLAMLAAQRASVCNDTRLLEKLICCPSIVLKNLHWDLRPPQLYWQPQKTLAEWSETLASSGVFPKLLTIFSEIKKTPLSINWNLALPNPMSDHKVHVTLAWHAVYRAYYSGEPRLLNELLRSPQKIFSQLLWNNTCLATDFGYGSMGQSLAWMAAALALRKLQPELLNKLLDVFEDLSEQIYWCSSILSKNDDFPGRPDTETLADKARILALTGHPRLLQKLLDSPVDILKTIEWNKNNLLAGILHAIPQHLPPTWIKKLIRPELIPLLIWDEPLTAEFKKLFDKKLPEYAQTLAGLPEQSLRILCENIFADKPAQKGPFYDYLNFLITMKSGQLRQLSSPQPTVMLPSVSMHINSFLIVEKSNRQNKRKSTDNEVAVRAVSFYPEHVIPRLDRGI
jgi:hypothetical protein